MIIDNIYSVTIDNIYSGYGVYIVYAVIKSPMQPLHVTGGGPGIE